MQRIEPPPGLWRGADTSREGGRPRVVLEAGKIEQGVVKLVLVLVELLRQVMEKQAMRRIEAGTLRPDEIERLGRSLMDVESTIIRLQTQFDIDDLNLDLGPIGHLLDG
jgi:hypothetical protein